MQGIVGGGLLVTAFVAVAALALIVAGRLYRMGRPRPLARPSGRATRRPAAAGQAGEPPNA